MRFEEVMPALRAGKTVRRRQWPRGKQLPGTDIIWLRSDIQQEDWEVVGGDAAETAGEALYRCRYAGDPEYDWANESPGHRKLYEAEAAAVLAWHAAHPPAPPPAECDCPPDLPSLRHCPHAQEEAKTDEKPCDECGKPISLYADVCSKRCHDARYGQPISRDAAEPIRAPEPAKTALDDPNWHLDQGPGKPPASEEGGASKCLGQIAWEAFEPQCVTPWSETYPEHREQWDHAAQAVRAAVLAEVQRELTEDEYAEVYEAFDNGGEDVSWPHVRAAVRKADELRSKRGGEK